MPAQTQLSALAAKLGGRIGAANMLHKDKPVETGSQRLPHGMKNAVAKINSLTIGTFKDEKNGPGTKGELYFVAKAVVVFSGNISTPAEHGGVRVLNKTTTLHSMTYKLLPLIPLCDMPAKGARKPSTFEDNFFDFQNFFKMLRFPPCQESDSMKTLMYFQGIINTLSDPKSGPVYISFSTREWTPPLTPEEIAAGKKLEDKEPMLFETWHERVDWTGAPKPPGGVNVVSSNGAPSDKPPTMGPDGLPIAPPGEAAESLEERVRTLLENAGEDQASANQLTQLAWDQGWTEAQTEAATEWDQIAEMALSAPATESQDSAPTVGSKWNYAARDSNGAKVKNGRGEDLPSQEVEVTSLVGDDSCTVKVVKTGKDVVSMRTKKPAIVKFEWLE